MKFTHAVTGEEVDVAFEELATFPNNNTIKWAADAYKSGMTKAQYKTALVEEKMFDEDYADALVKKLWWQLEADDRDGRGTE